MTSEQPTDKVVEVAVPSPDANEIHKLFTDRGIPVEKDTAKPTTNRLYLSHDGDALELTAEGARKVATMLETAADALDDHHDVRMPIGDNDDD